MFLFFFKRSTVFVVCRLHCQLAVTYCTVCKKKIKYQNICCILCIDKFKEGYKKKGKGKTKERSRLSESEPDVPTKEEPEPQVDFFLFYIIVPGSVL